MNNLSEWLISILSFESGFYEFTQENIKFEMLLNQTYSGTGMKYVNSCPASPGYTFSRKFQPK